MSWWTMITPEINCPLPVLFSILSSLKFILQPKGEESLKPPLGFNELILGHVIKIKVHKW